MSQCDSESEDQPRQVVNMNGDFTLLGSDPPLTFKLHEFNPVIPGGSVLAVRPVPSPQAVQQATHDMGAADAGVWTGTIFHPPLDGTPQTTFAARRINGTTPIQQERFVLRRRHAPHVSGLKTMLMYTDGSCLSNGGMAPRAGWAFIFKPGGVVSNALEQKGPDGIAYVHTSNRAELRAVIAALGFRAWWGEGWERIVIVTDSEYVANGATAWLRTWARRGWRTSGRTAVLNRDLWERLSVVMGEMAAGGCEVSFWRVPREWNAEADRAAKAAAEAGGGHETFAQVVGVVQ